MNKQTFNWDDYGTDIIACTVSDYIPMTKRERNDKDRKRRVRIARFLNNKNKDE